MLNSPYLNMSTDNKLLLTKSAFLKYKEFEPILHDQRSTEYIGRYILAGEAIFKIKTTKINVEYEFMVLLHPDDTHYIVFRKDKRPYSEGQWYWSKIGYIQIADDNHTLIFTRNATEFSEDDLAVMMFTSFLKKVFIVKTLPFTCTFSVSNYCPVCGKRLSNRKALELGYGEICLRFMKTHRIRVARHYSGMPASIKNVEVK